MKNKRLHKYNSKSSWVVIFLGLFFICGIVLKATSAKKIDTLIEADYSVSSPAFRESMGHLLGPNFMPGHRIETLLNGDEIFPSMLEAIRSAKKSITLEMYIWESGEVGMQFQEALIERAKAGVKIHVIVDGMGTLKLKSDDIKTMKDAEIEFVKMGRDRWYKIRLSINHRTHRKLMVVDGRVGFIGGVCIGDKWLGNGEKKDHWRDTHYRVEGDAAKQMQGIFAENWLETTSVVLQGEDYFPDIITPDSHNPVVVQCFKSGPKDGEENARLAHLLAIAAAKKNIRLSHAYFVPDNLAIKHLVAARQRGVKVEIIVPHKNDSQIGKAASRSRWDKLAEAGVEFFEFTPSLYHCKVMIVDDYFVSAGSVNFDNRSFRINDEANMNVLDKQFAAEQIRIFEEDKAKSAALTLAMLKQRPWYTKLSDYLAGLLRSQL